MRERRDHHAADDALEADLELRRVEREGDDRARKLARRLARVDVHTLEARHQLERAGVLPRRREG